MVLHAERGWLKARSGNRPEAMRIYHEVRQSVDTGRIPRVGSAVLAVSLGENDLALAALGEGIAERSPSMLALNVDPRWDALRGSPVPSPAGAH